MGSKLNPVDMSTFAFRMATNEKARLETQDQVFGAFDNAVDLGKSRVRSFGRALQDGDIDSIVRDGGDAGAVTLGVVGGDKGLGAVGRGIAKVGRLERLIGSGAKAAEAAQRMARTSRAVEAGSAARRAEQLAQGAKRALETDAGRAVRQLTETPASREAAQQAARRAEMAELADRASSGSKAARQAADTAAQSGKAAESAAQTARQTGQAASKHISGGLSSGQKAGTAIDEVSFAERKILPPSNPDLAALPKGSSWTENGFRTTRGAEYERIHARDSLHRDVYTRNGTDYALENGKLNLIPAKEVQTVPRLTPSTNADGVITAADLANAARNSGKIELPLYTVGEANRLPGSKNGLIAVLEPTGTGNPAAAAYQAGTAGAVSDIATGKQIVPALRYNNPNPRGMDFVKFDGYEVLPDGQTMLMIDSKVRLPLWSEATQGKMIETMQRVKEALDQNPGFRVVYEFPDEASRREAFRFIQQQGFDKVIGTRVRGQ